MDWLSYFYGLATIPVIVAIFLGGILFFGDLKARKKRLTEWLEDFSIVGNEIIFFNKKGAEVVRATKEKIYFPGSPVPVESTTGLKGYEVSIDERRFYVKESIEKSLKVMLI